MCVLLYSCSQWCMHTVASVIHPGMCVHRIVGGCGFLCHFVHSVTNGIYVEMVVCTIVYMCVH